MTFTVVLVREEDGGYSVSVPALPGCFTQGDDLPEALRNSIEAIECHLESLHGHGDPIPSDVESCSVDVRHTREAVIYKVAVGAAQPKEVAVA
ncbi:MAG: type II toxin-antitoxin system HicB family antitoxin [Armatimonadetes bacterium]|nr:type II toxin-antitoxin system HicB family antitoxin [Armatimonadota bacterium]